MKLPSHPIQSPTPTRTRRSPDQWQNLIANFDSASQSLTDYCKQNSIAVSGFYYWKKRLAPTTQVNSQKKTKRSSSFIELITPPIAIQHPHDINPASWRLEIELGSGMILRVR